MTKDHDAFSVVLGLVDELGEVGLRFGKGRLAHEDHHDQCRDSRPRAQAVATDARREHAPLSRARARCAGAGAGAMRGRDARARCAGARERPA
jgi:hypothetical protein